MMGHHATNKQVNFHDNAINTKEIAQARKIFEPDYLESYISDPRFFIFPFDTTLNAVAFGEILFQESLGNYNQSFEHVNPYYSTSVTMSTLSSQILIEVYQLHLTLNFIVTGHTVLEKIEVSFFFDRK
jgi:hypothetical protein